MTSSDCKESLHRAMCSTFNTDCFPVVTEIETLVKHDADDNKEYSKNVHHTRSLIVKEDCTITAKCEDNKPIKSDEHPPDHNEPAMELLLSSMSSTFDAECATCTDEADSLLNHDLAEDKTIKWRNLVNNKFAYKENITYKRGRRINKQTKNLRLSPSYIISNDKRAHSNKKQKKENQRSKICEKHLDKQDKSSVGRRSARALALAAPTAEYMERQIKYLLSDDEDIKRHADNNECDGAANEAFESQLIVCKEELIVADDDTLFLSANKKALSNSRRQQSSNKDPSNGLLDAKEKGFRVESVTGHLPQTKLAPSAVSGAKCVTEKTVELVLIKLESIQTDNDNIDENLAIQEPKKEQGEFAEEDALRFLTHKGAKDSNSELRNEKKSRTRKIKETMIQVDSAKTKKRIADKNKKEDKKMNALEMHLRHERRESKTLSEGLTYVYTYN
ncbi:calponin homology domain-containing protein DDB_G0272472-like isoform X2 [Eurosta solidaginis]|uniref:calponin homology domain-containing protein DDB_G0272472-like isoform X2 n=1 Tax=Eurosta solidaginis TaxID=178769 RepID=UPI003530D758